MACYVNMAESYRSRQLTFQNQIPRATIFRFPRLHPQIPRATFLADSSDSPDYTADSPCHLFCQIPQIPQITPVPLQIPRATFCQIPQIPRVSLVRFPRFPVPPFARFPRFPVSPGQIPQIPQPPCVPFLYFSFPTILCRQNHTLHGQWHGVALS